uniref:Gluzincin n=1 Tax=Rhipicephalus zambeziensis TaxID=60191 RepID=A0A224YD93_9ACAR
MTKKESTFQADYSVNAGELAGKVYNACVMQEHLESPMSVKKNVIEILKPFKIESWPLSIGPSPLTYKEILKFVGLRPLATVSTVGIELQHQYILSVNVPLPRFAPSPHMWVRIDEYEDALAAYRDFIRSVLTLIHPHETPSNRKYEEKDCCSKSSRQDTDSNDDDSKVIYDMLGDIVEVEKSLATMAFEAGTSPTSTIYTIEQWEKELGEDFLLFKALNLDFKKANSPLKRTDKILVHLPGYFKSMAEYLTKVRARNLYNYAGWFLVREIADGLTCHIRRKLNSFLQRTTKPGIAVQLNEGACVKKLIGHYGLMNRVITYLYLKNNFKEHSITQASNIAKVTGKQFNAFIRQNSWMEEKTKEKMRTWMEALEYHIGAHRDSLNESIVRKSYDIVKLLGPSSLPHCFHQLRENNYLQKLRLTKEGYEKKTIWPVSALDTKTAYYEDFTSLEMPAGALQAPIYKEEDVTSQAYGSLGSLAAEVMIRGLTEEGSVWTERKGKYSWERAQKRRFKTMLNCLKLQKRKQRSDWKRQKQDQQEKFEQSGGEFNLKTKLYDHIGVRISFKSFDALMSKCKETCPTMFAGDARKNKIKKFFSSFVRRHCGPDATEQDEYRVNYALKTFEAFTEAFECKPGDEMKGVDNCEIVPRTFTEAGSEAADSES